MCYAVKIINSSIFSNSVSKEAIINSVESHGSAFSFHVPILSIVCECQRHLCTFFFVIIDESVFINVNTFW